jgi:hypothetical protein
MLFAARKSKRQTLGRNSLAPKEHEPQIFKAAPESTIAGTVIVVAF